MTDVSPEWRRLMKLSAEIEYGRFEVIIKEGKPIRVEEARKQVRLDEDDDDNFNIQRVT